MRSHGALPIVAAVACGASFAVAGIGSYIATVETQNDWLRRDSTPVTAAEFGRVDASERDALLVARRRERSGLRDESSVASRTAGRDVPPPPPAANDRRAELQLDAGRHRLLMEKFDAYRELGALDRYRRDHDPVPVRPLIPIDGVTDDELQPYLEPPFETFMRLGALASKVPNPLRHGAFAVAGWPRGEEFAFAAGIQADNSGISWPIPRARTILRREQLPQPDAVTWGRLLDEMLVVGTKAEANRRATWRAVLAATRSPAARWYTPAEVAGVYVKDGTLHVIPLGDDSELDRLNHELAQLRRSATARAAAKR